mgnify:CR=1 FL=1
MLMALEVPQNSSSMASKTSVNLPSGLDLPYKLWGVYPPYKKIIYTFSDNVINHVMLLEDLRDHDFIIRPEPLIYLIVIS